MTDAEIEQIARLYCRKLGLDPDERKGMRGERWRYYTDFVRLAAIRECREAIAEVRATVTEGGV